MAASAAVFVLILPLSEPGWAQNREHGGAPAAHAAPAAPAPAAAPRAGTPTAPAAAPRAAAAPHAGWHGAPGWHGGVARRGGYDRDHRRHHRAYGWSGFGWSGPGYSDWSDWDYPGYYPAPGYAYGAPPANVWYYCYNPSGYYPYVQQCYGPWQPVPAG